MVCILYNYADTYMPELIEAGSDVNVVDNRGRSAIMLAILERKTNLASFLLSKGANLQGNTPLIIAASQRMYEMVRKLLPVSSINAKNHSGVTALMASISGVVSAGLGEHQEYDMDVVKNTAMLLLQNGANPQISDVNGDTPLIIAASLGMLKRTPLGAKDGSSDGSNDGTFKG